MKNEQKKKFKIRDLSTGLYQDGKIQKFPYEPTWSKKGKTWSDLEALKKHLYALEEYKISLSPLWEVIEYEKSVSSGDRYPASIFSLKRNRF